MNLKNKVFGFVAAAALTLSMVGGAAADTARGTVTLAPGTCGASLTSADFNFGTWTYNGVTNSYDGPADSTGEFTLSVVEKVPGGSCPVVIQFSGLSSGNRTIGPSHFSINVPNVYSGPMVNGRFDIPGREYAGTLKLNSVPSNYQPEEYTGEITVQLGNGA